MAASLSTPALTIEEFDRLYGGETPAYEYWDGMAIQKPAPTVLHSLLQFVLQALLKQKGLAAAAEVRIKVNLTREPVPDVIAGHHPLAPYPTEPMAIVIYRGLVAERHSATHPAQVPVLCRAADSRHLCL